MNPPLLKNRNFHLAMLIVAATGLIASGASQFLPKSENEKLKIEVQNLNRDLNKYKNMLDECGKNKHAIIKACEEDQKKAFEKIIETEKRTQAIILKVKKECAR